MCETPLGQASSQDIKLLKAAKEKHLKKPFLKKKPEEETQLQEKVGAQEEVSILSSAALSTYKMSKKRRYALSARSGLADKRPPPQNNSIWKTLIDSRQGFTYSDPWPPEEKPECQSLWTNQPLSISEGALVNIFRRTVQ